MGTVARQLASRLMEDDPTQPPAGAPKVKEREVLKPHQAYQNARKSAAELRELKRQADEVFAKLEQAIGVRAELTRHGLHPEDVARYVTRQSVASIARAEYAQLGLQWENAKPLDVVGVVMKDGQQFWFVEPVVTTPTWGNSLSAQDYNQNRAPRWGKPRKGLPYTVSDQEQNENR